MDDEDDDDDDDVLADYRDKPNITDTKLDDGGAGGGVSPADLERFEKEMVETLHRGIKNKLDVDAIVLEAGSLKLTHHALLQDYYAAAFAAFFGLTSPQPVEGKKAERDTLKSLMMLLKDWKPVLKKFAKEIKDQQLMVEGLAKCCVRHPEFSPLFAYTLNLIYDWELVEEDAFLDWEDEVIKEKDPAMMKVLALAEEFLTFLKEADEEEDEDD
uniref:W2 domain-containing protein n=1 Tax=Lotharella globosa TaxID=91324 RepID=A0A7S4DSQ2_9EUKA